MKKSPHLLFKKLHNYILFLFLFLLSICNEKTYAQAGITAFSFAEGSFQTLIVCENATSVNIDSILRVTDDGFTTSDSLHWRAFVTPRGTLLAGYSCRDTGATMVPTGLSYTTPAGFTGMDTFAVRVYDSAGTADTTYIYVTISAVPFPGVIFGADSVCKGVAFLLFDSAAGGRTRTGWTTTTPTIANIIASSITNDTITSVGLAAGIAEFIFSDTNSCGTSDTSLKVMVSDFPRLTSAIALSVCDSNYFTYTSTSDSMGATMTWRRNEVYGIGNPADSGINNISEYLNDTTHVAQIDTYVYVTMIHGCSTSADVIVTVNPTPNAGVISGIDSICPGDTVTLRSTQPGGTWLSANSAIATVNGSTGFVNGITTGTATIKYIVANVCGSDTATYTLYPHHSCLANVDNISTSKSDINVFPNPNQGIYTISISLPYNEEIMLTITNMLGEKVKEQTITTNKDVEVQMNVAVGVYYLSAIVNGERKVSKIVVE